jgi:hypothetical protein
MPEVHNLPQHSFLGLIGALSKSAHIAHIACQVGKFLEATNCPKIDSELRGVITEMHNLPRYVLLVCFRTLSKLAHINAQ